MKTPAPAWGRWRRWVALVAAVLLPLGAAGAPASDAAPRRLAVPETWSGTVTHVTDGDTLWVRPQRGGAPVKIRIDGVDAPEICQPHGERARAALEQRVLHQLVQVRIRAVDDYQRPLAALRLQGDDVPRWLVLQGHAWSYRYRRDAGPYAAEERRARLARRGLFADAQAELPRAFRKRHGPCD